MAQKQRKSTLSIDGKLWTQIMKPLLIKITIFILIVAVTGGLIASIHASADDAEEKKPVDVRPSVSVEALQNIDHQVEINSFGEVQALESTILAAQVSGEVLSWNENFVAGGVVKRGEILFTIEPDTYQAAVLQAEAQISMAQATLTEELARQKVAEKEARNLPSSQVSDLYLRKPQVLSAQAQLKSAQAGLRIAKRNLAKTQVRAPYDALVISREIGSGQFLSAGMKVAELSNIESAEILVPIAGFDSPFLKETINDVTALVETQGRVNVSRMGKIHRNVGVVDQNTRMQHLVIRIDDPYGIKNSLTPIQFGTYVKVSFAGKILQNVYKIPQSLINKRTMWLVTTDDQLASFKVNVLREEGEYFFIEANLPNTGRLVKNLPEYPQNGMAVKIIDGDEISQANQNNAISVAAN